MADRKRNLLRNGFVTGIGWAIGVTLGFVLISTFLIWLLRAAVGLPVVGDFATSVLEGTIDQLSKRTPLAPPN